METDTISQINWGQMIMGTGGIRQGIGKGESTGRDDWY